MSVTADKCGLQSLEYVTIMSVRVLWDLVHEKNEYTQLELSDILKALDIVHI